MYYQIHVYFCEDFFSDSSVVRFLDDYLRILLHIIFKIGTPITGGEGKVGMVYGLSMLSVVRSAGQKVSKY